MFERTDPCLTHGMNSHELVPFIEARKRGYLIEDLDGNTYADHIGGWGSSPFGPTPPSIKAAMDEAWAKHGMEISVFVPNATALALAQRLSALAPGRVRRIQYSVSGTLAVEGAVKHMREASGRPLIITFGGQYHGESSYFAAGVSSDISNVTTGSTQFVSGIVMIPYPNRFRSAFRRGPGPFDDCETLDYLDYLLVQQVHPGQVAGVLIEPVLGEGGIHVPSQAFWDRLGAMCKRWGWILCVDEVQTCMGRCGHMFAVERWRGIDPDMVLLGKSFCGGGAPIAAIMGTDEVMGHSRLVLGSTYGWVPAAAAGALAGIELIENGGVLENALALERIFLEEMGALKKEIEQVGDARAAGAFMALEFVQDKRTNRPAQAFQRAVHQACLRRGVLGISQVGKWHYRLQPAITMTPSVFRDSCARIQDAVRAVAKDPPRESATTIDGVVDADH
jgi:4-aminobutyrate aminotransferase/4-aminobutyrate aminotransferase/(S)-3-amino-2-methylpropionate transaminase